MAISEPAIMGPDHIVIGTIEVSQPHQIILVDSSWVKIYKEYVVKNCVYMIPLLGKVDNLYLFGAFMRLRCFWYA